ncbi:MAG TPA: TonB-dependent siderophore receptor [Rubrivivax sp.]|nr:TonB-dependent siderophore receptor [Rubrivivax sp.]HPO20755.1 TonB-dependent siderophore receptor [Rubrivivax sp.]
MASTTPHAAAWRRHCLSLSALLGSCVPLAATAQADAEAEPQQVTIRAAKPAAGVTGFGQIPLASVPMQASVTTTEQMRDLGVRRLSDIAHIDAAVGDGYNAEGYYDFLTVRGFVLDNRFNYRRDGLPISAETTIPLDNKSRVEVLKGTSGMLAGLGSPGGMVDFAVKRPTEAPLREATLGWRQDGSVLAATDLSDRFGARREFGLRVNAAYEHLDPQTYDAKGSRWLVALAGDWRVAARTLLEAEIEVSHREQPSVPGFSVLGTVVPSPGNPRINLNNQPWSQPGVFDATTASLRWRQALDAQWSFVAHAATQQLKTDDNTAFPYGCSAENRYDRYCSNGTYDMYDFRSDNERRRSNVVDLSLHGSLDTGALRHALTLGLQYQQVRNRFQDLAFNYAGTGNVQGTLIVPPAPALTGTNTNRDARAGEAYARDAVAFDERNTLWLGLRYTHQNVDTVRTDGSAALGYSQSYAAPWLAFSHKLAGGTMLYASWGTGYEADLAPNNPRYVNQGELLSPLRSQQFELGAKGGFEQGAWTIAAFDIERPVSASAGVCDVAHSCVWQRDGGVVHRGVEGTLAARVGAWSAGAGAMALHARREGSATAAINGLRPTNVPAYTLRLQLGYRVDSVPGLELLAVGAYDSGRIVLPDNSLQIPGTGRIDLGLRYEQQLGARMLTWRAGIENLTNERAWRESPYQFDHSYLFPLAPRTIALSIQAEL